MVCESFRRERPVSFPRDETGVSERDDVEFLRGLQVEQTLPDSESTPREFPTRTSHGAQPAIILSISFHFPFNRAGERISNVVQENET